MFDKDFMLSGKASKMYVKNAARQKMQEDMLYITDGMERMVTYIAFQVYMLNEIIRRYEAENKDTAFLVFERDYALFVLGLGDMPKLVSCSNNKQEE